MFSLSKVAEGSTCVVGGRCVRGAETPKLQVEVSEREVRKQRWGWEGTQRMSTWPPEGLPSSQPVPGRVALDLSIEKPCSCRQCGETITKAWLGRLPPPPAVGKTSRNSDLGTRQW